MIYDAEKVPTVRRQQVSYVCGLDLAQQEDASALAVVRCEKGSNGSIRLGLAHLDRWWSSYPETHRHVLQTLSRAELAGRCLLALDSTGVGLSFYETLKLDPQARAAIGDDRIVPVTITSGRQISRSGQFLRVGKVRLISELHAALARGTLRIAQRLPLRDELFREMAGFEAQVRATGSLAMGNNPKLAKHDDLVLAVAMAVVASRASFGELDDAYKSAANQVQFR